VPEFNYLPDVSVKFNEFYEEVESSPSDSCGSLFHSGSAIPESFKQEELGDLTRDQTYLKRQ